MILCGGKFLVDVDAWLELRKSGSFYDLNDSINYADLFSACGLFYHY